MKIKFTKMHGCGNNYIFINCFNQKIVNPEELSIKLSEPHFGIGGDGIILINPSNKADAEMRIFNADGSEGKMCGNGIRCVGKYLYDNNIIGNKSVITINTLSGIKTLKLSIENNEVSSVQVDMGKAILNPAKIPVLLEGDKIINESIIVNNNEYKITTVSMGNPHCVIFCDEDIDNLDIESIGPKFENNQIFPDRVNTEFVNVLKDGTFKMRVWERGSGETWACGTGACAVGVAACLNSYAKQNDDILIHLRGGDLVIKYTEKTVIMTGSATTIFEGEIIIEA